MYLEIHGYPEIPEVQKKYKRGHLRNSASASSSRHVATSPDMLAMKFSITECDGCDDPDNKSMISMFNIPTALWLIGSFSHNFICFDMFLYGFDMILHGFYMLLYSFI